MRTHRVANIALTAAVGLGTLIGTAAPAFAAPQPSNGSVIVQKGPQGPVQGPKDLASPTTTPTTVKPQGPGDLTLPPHVDPPPPLGPGDIANPTDPGCTGLHCGPGDIANPTDPGCTGPHCGPGDITNPTDPCKVPRTNDAGDPCEPGGTTGGTDGGTTDGGTTAGGGTTGGGTTTGGGHLPHTGMDLGEELAAGAALTGLGALLVRAARRRRTAQA